MGIFSKKSPKEKLQKKYEKLMKESYDLSRSNRKASDQKVAEAEEVLKEIDALA
ncbi:Lacal_2735 family protein [Ekhidna sp. To15]|uniref:Lacal_2735 family protein n=1 Tax=Ekhidna sp. To15 TaxID=3395267 RepID=UPI003F526303